METSEDCDSDIFEPLLLRECFDEASKDFSEFESLDSELMLILFLLLRLLRLWSD